MTIVKKQPEPAHEPSLRSDAPSDALRSPDLRTDSPLLSVVIPVHNEAGNIAPLLAELEGALSEYPGESEVILVDDGSTDDTWSALEKACKPCPSLRVFRLSRNFGHQKALLAGLHQARGEMVVSMDGDLQHPPRIICELVQQWRRGYKIVLTRRRDRQVTGRFKRFSSRWFYRIFSHLAGFSIHQGASDFRLMDRQPLDELLRFRDSSPFLRGAVELLGFPKTIVEFDVQQRHSGESKYNLRKMIAFSGHALIAHSTVPLRIGIWIGLVTSAHSFLELLYIVTQFALGNTVPGWASTIGITSLFFGILFLLVGIIGAYVAEIHTALKSRPQFIISQANEHESQR